MKTISVISQKGGARKTTIATNLAGIALAAGYEACLFDMDQQATARAWSSWRNPQNPTLDPEKPIIPPEVITTPHGQLTETLARAKALGAEIVFIDTPPNADTTATKAAKEADLILVPCQPSVLIAVSRKPAYVILNGVHPQAKKEIEDATKILSQHNLSIAPVILTDRTIYKVAGGRGKLVSELEPIGPAARELEKLWEFITEQLDIATSKQDAAA